MPNSRFPRVVGFQIPGVKEAGAPDAEPLVVLLDTPPTPNWVAVCNREAERLKANTGLSEVKVDDDRLLAFGLPVDLQDLTVTLRAFVERVSQLRMEERFQDAGSPTSPASRT